MVYRSPPVVTKSFVVVSVPLDLDEAGESYGADKFPVRLPSIEETILVVQNVTEAGGEGQRCRSIYDGIVSSGPETKTK